MEIGRVAPVICYAISCVSTVTNCKAVQGLAARSFYNLSKIIQTVLEPFVAKAFLCTSHYLTYEYSFKFCPHGRTVLPIIPDN